MAVTEFNILSADGSQAPIQGKLFIDGILVGSGSKVSVDVADGSHEVTASADGFDSYTSPVVFPQPTNTILLGTSSTSVSRIPFTLTITPSGLNSVSYTYSQTGGADTVTGAIIDDVTSDQLLPKTQYDLTVSAEGYTPFRAGIDTGLADSISVGLSTSTDLVSQRQNLQPAPVLRDIGGNPIAPRNSALTPPEFVYPNSVDGKYFTTTQARLYIGNVFIDELNWLQFALQDNKVPIYGYRSRYYDAMAQGKSLVQGQLGINFVSEGYLWTVLSEYNRLAQDNLKLSDPNGQYVDQLSSLEDQTQTDDVVARKKEIIAKLPPNAVDQLKKRREAKTSPTQLFGFTNPLYLDVPFDLQVEFEGGGRTVVRRLEDCFLIANEQVLDQSGNPLTDGYSFIARRLR